VLCLASKTPALQVLEWANALTLQPSRHPPLSQPPPEGQERVKEDWEYYFPQMMAAGFVIWGFIYVNQPYSCVEDWAMEEAKRRIALREAEEA